MRKFYEQFWGVSFVNLMPDFLALWRNAVLNGQLKTEFTATHDDERRRWIAGDRLVVGVRDSPQGFRHYARNLSSDEGIDAGFAEKRVPGSDYFCQFNGYRALRPRAHRSSQRECLFRCHDAGDESSLLKRTPLFQIKLESYIWNAYHNLAPVDVLGHFLWVPAPIDHHHEQKLDRRIIEDFFLLRSIDPNFVLFFNSLGGGASVDHLHFQAVYRRERLAIEKQPALATAKQIFELADGGVPFNLIASSECVYLIARHVEPETRVSALDLAGRIVTTDRTVYEAITREEIDEALSRASFPNI